MRWLRFILVVSILAVVSVRWPAELTRVGAAPVFLLVPALFVGFRARPGTAALLGWLSGLVVDLLSLEPLGLHAFLFGLAAWGVARVRGAVFADHSATRAVIAAIAAFLVLLALLFRLAAAEASFSVLPWIPAAFLSALLTGAAVPLLGLADGRLRIFLGFTEDGRRV